MARLFKGVSNEKEEVEVQFSQNCLFIDDITFPLDEITLSYFSKEEIVFHFKSYTLKIKSSDRHFNDVYKKISSKKKTFLLLTSLSAVSLFFLIFAVVTSSNQIARKIPDTYFDYFIRSNDFSQIFGDATCKVGKKLTLKIFKRLKIIENYQLYLLDVNFKNAFAFPDSKIVFTKDLVSQLNDEEFLAILGHEVGHLHFRHYRPALVRATIVDFIGIGISNKVLTLLGGLSSSMHSREAERESDEYSARLMRENGISVSNNISAMEKITENSSENKYLSFISSHPLTSERIDYFKSMLNLSGNNTSDSSTLVKEILKYCSHLPDKN